MFVCVYWSCREMWSFLYTECALVEWSKSHVYRCLCVRVTLPSVLPVLIAVFSILWFSRCVASRGRCASGLAKPLPVEQSSREVALCIKHTPRTGTQSFLMHYMPALHLLTSKLSFSAYLWLSLSHTHTHSHTHKCTTSEYSILQTHETGCYESGVAVAQIEISLTDTPPLFHQGPQGFHLDVTNVFVSNEWVCERSFVRVYLHTQTHVIHIYTLSPRAGAKGHFGVYAAHVLQRSVTNTNTRLSVISFRDGPVMLGWWWGFSYWAAHVNFDRHEHQSIPLSKLPSYECFLTWNSASFNDVTTWSGNSTSDPSRF